MRIPRSKLFSYPKWFIKTQGFGQNANESYAKDGLIGHTAVDYFAYFGAVVPFLSDGVVYKVLNKDNANLGRFRAVYVLADIPGLGLCEVSYGHLDKIFAFRGQQVKIGEYMGTMGNTGMVYSNGKLITTKQKKEGSKAGAHVHGPQVRPVVRQKKLSIGEFFLRDSDNQMFKDDEGYYYMVKYKNNGFRGCVKPPMQRQTSDQVFGLRRGLHDIQVALAKLLDAVKVAKLKTK